MVVASPPPLKTPAFVPLQTALIRMPMILEVGDQVEELQALAARRTRPLPRRPGNNCPSQGRVISSSEAVATLRLQQAHR